jgi:hypothetical protein
MAEVEKLAPISDAAMIAKVAKMFSLDPDEVYNKSADWVFMWLYVSKMEGEYQDRFNRVKELTSKRDLS